MEVTPPHELLTQLTVLALLALLTLLKLLAHFHAYMPTHMATSSERFKILPKKNVSESQGQYAPKSPPQLPAAPLSLPLPPQSL